MTDAEREPGWYTALRKDGSMVKCIECVKDGWILDHEIIRDLWPYMSWKCGPRVEDLLRDAARYRWLVRTDNISSAFYEDFAATALTTGNVIDAEIAREKESGND